MNYKDGGRGIRTPGTVPRTVVFKTTGFSRSPIPPVLRILSGCGEFQILDGQIVFAVRLFGAEFQWGRQWIRMFDGHDPEIGFPFHRYKVSPFGLNFKLLSILQCDRKREGLALFVFAEIDALNRVQRDLAMKFLLSVGQDSLTTAAFDKTGKLGILDNEFLPIIKTDDNCGARRLKPEDQKCI